MPRFIHQPCDTGDAGARIGNFVRRHESSQFRPAICSSTRRWLSGHWWVGQLTLDADVRKRHMMDNLTGGSQGALDDPCIGTSNKVCS